MFSIFPKNEVEQVLRIKRFLMAFGSYLMWIAIIVFVYSQELTRVPFNLLVISFSGVFVCNIFIYAIIRTGLNKRFKDPSLTLIQMVIATFWAMLVVYYAESLRSAVLLVYLIVFVFGLFRLNIRQFLFLSAFAVVSYTLVILLLYTIHPESINKKTDILNILILAMVLPWFSLVGRYITKLRNEIYENRSTIERWIDNIPDVIFVLDMNLNYIYVSPSVKILRGYEPEEVLKQTPLDALTRSSLDLVMKTFSAFIELEKLGHKVPTSRTLQLEAKRKDGTTVWTETMFSLIRDENRQPVRIIGVMRDITERKGVSNKST
jgi:PAS domain S-box-containing protein